MLVEAMNNAEITREVLRDYYKLTQTTSRRLQVEYDRERKKLKIDKKKTYPKVYPVKTASKNTWLLFLGKAPALEKYIDVGSINLGFVVYYYNAKGLRVFNKTTNLLEVYNGHFFKRFNERQHINLDNPVDIVKQYFMYGGYSTYSVVKKEEKCYTIGISSEGILLGELQHGGQWLVNKTFISRTTANPHHDETEKQLLALLQIDICKVLTNNTFNTEKKEMNLDVIKAISGVHKD